VLLTLKLSAKVFNLTFGVKILIWGFSKKIIIMHLPILLICIILGQIISNALGNLYCAYDEGYILSIKFYSCNIFGVSSNQISGNHKSSKNDSNVNMLRIKKIKCTINDLSSNFCEKFKNLEIYGLLDAGIESIDGDSFNHCKNLKFLNLSRNKIRKIPQKLFKKNSKLEVVSFSENIIKFVSENLFPTKNVLRILDLSQNNLKSLPQYVFKHLKSLEKLSLNNNKLEALYPAQFSSLKELTELILYNNFINILPENIFTNLKSLEILNIGRNRLQTINENSFGSHPRLNNIDLSSNQINMIDKLVIDRADVSVLDLRNNSCANDKSSSKNDVLNILKKCIDNYQLVQKVG